MRIIKESEIKMFMKSWRERFFAYSTRNAIHHTVEKIINDVRKNGDKAIKRYTKKFDSIRLRELLIDSKEIEASAKKAGNEFLKAMKLSAKRIRAFHELQKEESWYFS